MSRETTIYEDLAAILLQFTKDVKEGSIATVPVEGEDLKVTNVIDASPQAIAFLPAEHMKLQVFFSLSSSCRPFMELVIKNGPDLRAQKDQEIDRRHPSDKKMSWTFGAEEELQLTPSPRVEEGVDFQSSVHQKRAELKTWKAQPYKFDFRSMRTSQTSNRRDPYLKETNNTNVWLYGSFVCFAYNNALFG